jgi:hypothetical protein
LDATEHNEVEISPDEIEIPPDETPSASGRKQIAAPADKPARLADEADEPGEPAWLADAAVRVEAAPETAEPASPVEARPAEARPVGPAPSRTHALALASALAAPWSQHLAALAAAEDAPSVSELAAAIEEAVHERVQSAISEAVERALATARDDAYRAARAVAYGEARAEVGASFKEQLRAEVGASFEAQLQALRAEVDAARAQAASVVQRAEAEREAETAALAKQLVARHELLQEREAALTAQDAHARGLAHLMRTRAVEMVARRASRSHGNAMLHRCWRALRMHCAANQLVADRKRFRQMMLEQQLQQQQRIATMHAIVGDAVSAARSETIATPMTTPQTASTSMVDAAHAWLPLDPVSSFSSVSLDPDAPASFRRLSHGAHALKVDLASELRASLTPEFTPAFTPDWTPSGSSASAATAKHKTPMDVDPRTLLRVANHKVGFAALDLVHLRSQ